MQVFKVFVFNALMTTNQDGMRCHGTLVFLADWNAFKSCKTIF